MPQASGPCKPVNATAGDLVPWTFATAVNPGTASVLPECVVSRICPTRPRRRTNGRTQKPQDQPVKIETSAGPVLGWFKCPLPVHPRHDVDDLVESCPADALVSWQRGSARLLPGSLENVFQKAALEPSRDREGAVVHGKRPASLRARLGKATFGTRSNRCRDPGSWVGFSSEHEYSGVPVDGGR